jgi:hypothetical protein
MSFFVSFDQCRFEVYFVRYKYCYSCLFSGTIGFVNLLPAFHPKPILISVDEIGVMEEMNYWIFFVNPVYQMVSFDGGIKSINIEC